MFQIQGSVSLDAIPSPPYYRYYDKKELTDKRYMLYLQAYVFSASGKLIWEQQGFPHDEAWVPLSGSTQSFTLINSFTGSLSSLINSELIIIACGDPLPSESFEMRVILGAYRSKLK